MAMPARPSYVRDRKRRRSRRRCPLGVRIGPAMRMHSEGGRRGELGLWHEDELVGVEQDATNLSQAMPLAKLFQSLCLDGRGAAAESQ